MISLIHALSFYAYGRYSVDRRLEQLHCRLSKKSIETIASSSAKNVSNAPTANERAPILRTFPFAHPSSPASRIASPQLSWAYTVRTTIVDENTWRAIF